MTGCRYAASDSSVHDDVELDGCPTTQDSAEHAGLSRFRYQRYEKGEGRPGEPANPHLRTLVAIAQALDTTVDAIVPHDLPDLTAR